MINFSCIQDLIDIANAQERTIDDIVVEYEATHSFKSVIYIKENMQTIWQVMKESADAAYSCFLSRATQLGLTEKDYKEVDIHIHVPEGAIPKDGPSAGIALYTTIVSLMTKKPVKKTVAMTGEITLRGKVLPIGGLKEKLLAASRGGIKTVLIPVDNVKDLKEIPDNIKNTLEVIPVANIEEVLKNALV